MADNAEETDARVRFRVRVRVQRGRKKRVWIHLGFLGFRVTDTGHTVRTGGWGRCGECLCFPPNQFCLLQLILGVWFYEAVSRKQAILPDEHSLGRKPHLTGLLLEPDTGLMGFRPSLKSQGPPRPIRAANGDGGHTGV